MNQFSDLPDTAKNEARKSRERTIRSYAENIAELDHWTALMDIDAFLLEAVRGRLSAWAKRGDGHAAQIVGQTIGAMLAYGVEPNRAMMAVQFVLHGSKGPVNP